LLKKRVTYTDFNGKEVTEELRFHLSKAELIEMEVAYQGGLGAYLQRIVETNDGGKILAAFKRLLLDSYGVVSEDGKRFIKSEKAKEEFASTEAYSTLFMELATNAEAAAEFVNGIMPANLEQDVEKLRETVTPDSPQRERQVTEATPVVEEKVLTRAEAEEMDKDELTRKILEGWRVNG